MGPCGAALEVSPAGVGARLPLIMRIECPICKRVLVDAPDDFGPRPFCRPACKMIDLGNWLSDAYRIPVSSGEDGTVDDDLRTLS